MYSLYDMGYVILPINIFRSVIFLCFRRVIISLVRIVFLLLPDHLRKRHWVRHEKRPNCLLLLAVSARPVYSAKQFPASAMHVC